MEAKMDNILEAISIKKTFGGVIALKDGSLTCRRGKITGLLGANGSGKSTISKIITGLYQYDSGTIKLKGKEVRFKSPDEARQNGVAMFFQNLSLVEQMSVWENVVLGREKKKGVFTDNESDKEVARKWIRRLSDTIDIEKNVEEMSPSQKQIVEIAKAMCTEPDILILDEPTAALEQREVDRLFQVMREQAERGVAIVFISHRLREVTEICNDVVIFRNGENVGEINFDQDGTDTKEIISYITGSEEQYSVGSRNAAGNSSEHEVIYSARQMSYQEQLIDIDLDIHKGEVLGVGGLAGQGQDELLLALSGYYKIVGDITLEGKQVEIKSPRDAIRKGIVLVPGDRQTEGLFMDHSVLENLIFPKYCLKGTPSWLPLRKYAKESAETVDILSIKTDSLQTGVNFLSGGNQQKVVVGKWLPLNPKVLLLADPAKGVDIGAKKELYDFIRKLVRENQMSVVLYASDNEELVENCDRVLIMFEGKIVEQLEGDNISDKKITELSLHINKERG